MVPPAFGMLRAGLPPATRLVRLPAALGVGPFLRSLADAGRRFRSLLPSWAPPLSPGIPSPLLAVAHFAAVPRLAPHMKLVFKQLARGWAALPWHTRRLVIIIFLLVGAAGSMSTSPTPLGTSTSIGRRRRSATGTP